MISTNHMAWQEMFLENDDVAEHPFPINIKQKRN